MSGVIFVDRGDFGRFRGFLENAGLIPQFFFRNSHEHRLWNRKWVTFGNKLAPYLSNFRGTVN